MFVVYTASSEVIGRVKVIEREVQGRPVATNERVKAFNAERREAIDRP